MGILVNHLLIVQPYVPAYRVAFFDRLVEQLAEDGIICTIAAGRPVRAQGERGDKVTNKSWLVQTRSRQVSLLGKTVASYGSIHAQRRSRGIIVGLLGSSPDTYAALARGRLTGRRIGVWGHIKPYVQEANRLDAALERWQMRSADHVFAYTAGGADYALLAGTNADKVTTVMNSVDVSDTLSARNLLTESDVQRFRDTHRLVDGKTAAYIGGIDASKRIDFLCEALDILWATDPEFKLVIAGKGDQEYLLDHVVARRQVIKLGFGGPLEKALISRAAQVMAMPGRIGLVAVECLALNLPIVTTPYRHHAPEHEYLVEGESRYTSGESAFDFASTLARFAGERSASRRLDLSYPTIDEMVSNFRRGVHTMLG